jgi:hypothetical protein
VNAGPRVSMAPPAARGFSGERVVLIDRPRPWSSSPVEAARGVRLDPVSEPRLGGVCKKPVNMLNAR